MTDRTRQKFLESFRQLKGEYAIGIDPDKGFAMWDYAANTFALLQTVDLIAILLVLSALPTYTGITLRRLVVEASYKNKAVWGIHRRSFMRAGVQGRKALAEAVAKSRGTGMNQKSAKLIVEWARWHGFQPYESVPNRRSMTKLSAAQFLEYTGVDCNSEHARDAGMLVFDRR